MYQHRRLRGSQRSHDSIHVFPTEGLRREKNSIIFLDIVFGDLYLAYKPKTRVKCVATDFDANSDNPICRGKQSW